MARFPYYKRNITELGKILARARTDEEYRKRLIEDPNAELARVGLPDETHKLMTFLVVDASDQKAVALPYRLNPAKLERSDPDYLGSIGRSFTSVN